MQHAKKFLLVSVDGMQRYKEKQKLTDEENHISNNAKLNSQDLVSEMRQTLSNFLHTDSNIPQDQKNELYGFHQSEFLNLRDAALKRKNTNNDGGNKNKRQKTNPILNSAMGYFNRFYPETAERLAQFIVQRVPRLQWNEKSEISIDGHLIPGSNLMTLMEDVMRTHRAFEPVGFMEFAAVLKEAGLPANLVGEKTGVYVNSVNSVNNTGNVKAERTLRFEDIEDNANDDNDLNESYQSSFRDTSG